jgi:hypothetical protein
MELSSSPAKKEKVSWIYQVQILPVPGRVTLGISFSLPEYLLLPQVESWLNSVLTLLPKCYGED